MKKKYLECRIETVHTKTFSLVAFQTSVVAFTCRRGAFLLFTGDGGAVVLFAVAGSRRSRSVRRTDADVAGIAWCVAGYHPPSCNNSFVLKPYQFNHQTPSHKSIASGVTSIQYLSITMLMFFLFSVLLLSAVCYVIVRCFDLVHLILLKCWDAWVRHRPTLKRPRHFRRFRRWNIHR